ncbi:hypothetical protein BOTBODRAFT_109620 [Botryobasidium botryosum FD-172 SS1]|uniref:C2H2-type domain-containing protein n=1 Tax=Botryobasidium botryosum (strain FD-172 SS1) TaxID=930990 RepID=A0A067MTP9_BOTB1|nr:hypothetical protein BOTBODRAFT_109620 [Botryobasidium botryosum FD-172 SS1]
MTTKKRYQCTWDGCGKAYTKPTRLDEHERSHTHDRPFVCATCSKSYLRESHLNAHARSHQPESAKPFQCDVGGCSKRFWTKQHLQRHDDVHKGEKPFKCKEDGCQEAFTKHHQLRSHFAQAHCPEGTKNFVCEHSGCTKSFATSQKLENHAKVHKDKRYACTNSTCLSSGSAFFSKWSALQAHIREAHRPTCHHPDCNGRTFASTASLNMHEKIHEDAALEARVLGHLDDGVDNESENSERPQKRRRGGELGRDWKCDEEGCTKEFKSKKALTNHVNISHLGERKFACPRDGCSMTFGYKHVLQRHLSRHDAPSASASVSQKGGGKVKGKVSTIDIITGKHYANHTETKTIHCPWPDLFDVDPAKRALLETEGRDTCPHRFGRAYDLRRHLKAAHDFEVEADVLKIWVKGQHAATAKNISTDGGDGADGGDDLSA